MRYVSRQKIRSIIKRILYGFMGVMLFFGIESWAMTFSNKPNQPNRPRHHSQQEPTIEIRYPSAATIKL